MSYDSDNHISHTGPKHTLIRDAMKARAVDGYVPSVGHVPLTPPCGCGLPLLKSDRVCPRCLRVLR